jgi:hypothetical protein
MPAMAGCPQEQAVRDASVATIGAVVPFIAELRDALAITDERLVAVGYAEQLRAKGSQHDPAGSRALAL